MKWLKKIWSYSIVRKTIKTMAQAALAVITLQVGSDFAEYKKFLIQNVDWLSVLSVASLAGIYTILMNIKDIKE